MDGSSKVNGPHPVGKVTILFEEGKNQLVQQDFLVLLLSRNPM